MSDFSKDPFSADSSSADAINTNPFSTDSIPTPPRKKNNTTHWVALGIGCGGCVFSLMALGLLIALLLPAIQAAREVARRMSCTGHACQISVALQCYHVDHKSFPPAYTTDEDGKPLHSWRVLLLSYLDEDLHKQIRLDEPWDSEYNRQFHDKMPEVYGCPSELLEAKEKGLTSYKWVVGPNTISDGSSTTSFDDVSAGLSNVVYLVEVIPTTCWMEPVDIQESELTGAFSSSGLYSPGLGSFHSGGFNVGFLDGSIKFIVGKEHGGVSYLRELVKISRDSRNETEE